MGSQGPGRKRTPSKNGLTAEEDALNIIAREAEARLAAKRAARAEAREIRMKELERQQKEIYQVQKKYYGLDKLDNKWGDIEQWMEDSERYTRSSQRHASVSDDEERMSVGSRSNVRLDLAAAGAYSGLPQAAAASSSHSLKKSKKKKKHSSRTSNGYDDDLSTVSSRISRLSDESKASRSSRIDLQSSAYYSSELYSSSSYTSKHQGPSYNGYQGSTYKDSLYSGSRRSSIRASSEYSGFLGSSSRTSSRANSACGSPVVDDRLERDYLEKGSSRASTISGTTLTSLGGTSSRRGSGDTSITVDTEASIREIKEIHELKDQIQDVEAKHVQNLKELKDALLEVEEKFRKAMVSNAQLDNEKTNLIYEVDTLKDSLIGLEEMLFETRRELEDRSKDLEREKHAHSILQFQFNEVKETLKQSEDLLTEIRQLRLKQDGFVREISDLQETVEWKNKKIGALERQKEFSDAIRNERDELRDEVVQLKDILKKHGIVLGPDLVTNGETGEQAGEADPNSQTSSAEIRDGSSVLGTHQLEPSKDQHQKDLDTEVQLSSHVPFCSTKTPLKATLRDKINQGVGQSENRPEVSPTSVGEDVLTSARPIDEIKVEESILEDSGCKIVELECDVHTDAHMNTDQQDGIVPVDLSQVIKEEAPIESFSGPILDKDQSDEGELDNKSKDEPVELFKTEKLPQTQGASASNKKRKKKKKGKQKQSKKQESDKKVDDNNEKVLSENNPNQKMERDHEGNRKEPLGNYVSQTKMDSKVPADSHDDDKRTIETDSVKTPSTNLNADDARDTFQSVTDEADLGKGSKTISNFDCPVSRTSTGVLSDAQSNLTSIIDEQTEDPTIPGQDVVILSSEIDSSEKKDLLSPTLSKPMDAVGECAEPPESISNSENIENFLSMDVKEVKSDLDSDAVEQQARLQNIDPDGTTFHDDHDASAPNLSLSSVLKMAENEAEIQTQEQASKPIDQELEIHLQDSIQVDQKDIKTQQDVEENPIISNVLERENVKYTAVSDTLVQHIGEEAEEEGRLLQDRVKHEACMSGEDETNQESVESGASDQKLKIEKCEEDKLFLGQVIPEAQLSKEDLASKESVESEAFEEPNLEKDEDDEKERSLRDEVIPEAPLSGEDEASQESVESEAFEEPNLEKDEKERSLQDEVIPVAQLSGKDPANQESVESEAFEEPNLEKDEKERSLQDEVIPVAQLSGKDPANQESVESEDFEEPNLEKDEDDEKERSLQDEVIPEAPLSGEDEANRESVESGASDQKPKLEKFEEDEKEKSSQNQVMLDTQLAGDDEDSLVESDVVAQEPKEENEEEDEGESFDFDDMDHEASSDLLPKISLDQPNMDVTLFKENMLVPSQDFQSDVIDEDRTQDDELAAHVPKPKEHMDDGLAIEDLQTTTEVEGCLPEVNKEEVGPSHQQHDKEFTVKKHLQAADVRHDEGVNLISEMGTKDLGQEIIHHESKISGEQEVERETTVSNKEDYRKESKKSGKKGKGKGKEECKMS
ncbi:nestin isoform X4 [Xyrauchen texanus]|uniref:nestin isoform X4 n=1 Tax=Xyrauchen texanus TaxID=154827 RepID=UPI0022423EB5|nr:nestin isoform X4 [Xyrauchen texanus]